jgi:peptidoglycan/LPS O-acetylase OafA/YrhL
MDTQQRPSPPSGPSRRPAERRTDAGRRGGRRLRAEIQALRALAVGLVIVYHLRPSALPGGYVGVDVFFVISGYLISRHLLKEAATTGRVDLAAFWAGRVRRILPAALLTTVAVVVGAALLLPRTAAADVGRTAWWAALSAANWLFAAHAVDYQAQSPDASPFEHFWSLGVEEQFYLVWPILALAVAVLVRRRGGSVRRAAAVPFGLVLAASLAFGVWFTSTGSQAAYFITPTRMWELAAGGLLAALLGDRRLPPALAAVLQVLGLAAVLAGAIVFDAHTPMPGVAALLPVAGAAAFIAGGDVPFLRRAWAMRPIRFTGDISYSLYLWHWPVIVFVRAGTGHPIGHMGAILISGASVLIASASYFLVEQPMRRVPIRRPLRMVIAGGGAVALVVAIGAVPVGRDAAIAAGEEHARQRVLLPASGAPLGYPNLNAAADPTWARAAHVVVPAAEALPNDLAFGPCTIDALSTTSRICVRGDTASTTTVAVVGDSHVRQWGEALDRLGQRNHWRILTLLHNSCPFSLTPRPLERDGLSHCTDAVRWALPVLRAQHARVVLTSAYRKSYPSGELVTAANGYSAIWRTLQRDGIRVVALGDTPTPPSSPVDAECIVAKDPARCGSPRSQAEAVRDPLKTAAEHTPGVPFLDPVAAFCGATWCPGVIGNVGVYVDDNHASNTYVLSTLPWLQQHLAPLLARAVRGPGGADAT